MSTRAFGPTITAPGATSSSTTAPAPTKAPSPIATGVTVDLKNPTRYLPAIGQGGIGLPDRDYFLLEGPSFDKARAAYRAHLTATA